MRRRNRDINVFSLSMLDVLCGALGAVLIVMSVLSTRPEESVDPERLKELEKRVEDLERRLRVRRPLAVQIWWRQHEDQNIDLYVRLAGKDPEPDLSKKQWHKYNGDARLDNFNRHRSELWLMRDVPTGSYEVYVKLMGEPQKIKTTTVEGWYFLGWDIPTNERAKPIGTVTLSPSRRIVRLCTLTMNAKGELSMQLGPGVTGRSK